MSGGIGVAKLGTEKGSREKEGRKQGRVKGVSEAGITL